MSEKSRAPTRRRHRRVLLRATRIVSVGVWWRRRRRATDDDDDVLWTKEVVRAPSRARSDVGRDRDRSCAPHSAAVATRRRRRPAPRSRSLVVATDVLAFDAVVETRIGASYCSARDGAALPGATATTTTAASFYGLDVAQIPSARLTALFLCDTPHGGTSHAARSFASSFGKERTEAFGADFSNRPESRDDALLAAIFRRTDAAVFDRQDSERLARLYEMTRSASSDGHLAVKTRYDIGRVSPAERSALQFLFVQHSKTRFRELEALTGLRSAQLGRTLDVVLARRYSFLAVQFPPASTGAAAHYWHYRAPSPAALASRTMGRRVFSLVAAPVRVEDGRHVEPGAASSRLARRSLSETLPDDAIEVVARHLWLPDAVALYSTARTLYHRGTAYLGRAVSPSENRREFPDGVTFVFSCTVPDRLRRSSRPASALS